MSSARSFRIAHDRLMESLHEHIEIAITETDVELEKLAVAQFGAAADRPDDGFGPPEHPVKVNCLHCGDKYSSSEMKLAYRPRAQAIVCQSLGEGLARLEPLWWCKNADCDGGGFGHDIHPVNARKSRKAAA